MGVCQVRAQLCLWTTSFPSTVCEEPVISPVAWSWSPCRRSIVPSVSGLSALSPGQRMRLQVTCMSDYVPSFVDHFENVAL